MSSKLIFFAVFTIAIFVVVEAAVNGTTVPAPTSNVNTTARATGNTTLAPTRKPTGTGTSNAVFINGGPLAFFMTVLLATFNL